MTTSEKVQTKVPTKAIVSISAALIFGAGVAAVIFLNLGTTKVSTTNTPVAITNTNTTNTNATTTTSVGMYKQIWISQAEIDALPPSGQLWDYMKAAADLPFPVPAVCSTNDPHDTYTLATALVWAKTQNPLYRTKAANAIDAAIGTEDTNPCPLGIVGSRHQGLEFNGAAYVIAADLINLPNYDTTFGTTINVRFKNWITGWLTRRYDSGFTMVEWMEQRPQGVGTKAGAVLAAAYSYLDNRIGLDHVHQVFKGFMGDRTSWTWNLTPTGNPDYFSFIPDGQPFRPINPVGATKQGYDVGGYLVGDWNRCGYFASPPLGPCYTFYIWSQSGLLVQAEILENMGYGNVFAYEQDALKRMIDAIHREYISTRVDHANFWTVAQGEQAWQPYFINYAYGTNLPETPNSSVSPLGNVMGWSWQFEGRSRTTPSGGGGGCADENHNGRIDPWECLPLVTE